MASERMQVSVAEARALGEAAMRGIGYDAEDARILADHVIDAALCGYEYSGLAKLLNIPDHRRFAMPRRPMAVLRETAVSVLYDGGNNCGMIALHHAARAAIDKAAGHGIALVGVTNSWMSGRSAYYVEMIARSGLVAIHSAAAAKGVAPPGGRSAALGTNPIAFALPAEPEPLVFDMGTSAFMQTEVAYRERIGIPLPEGVALDPDGNPTRDPHLGRIGAMLPWGGYKGYGLALVVQALGVVAGSALDEGKEDGYLFVVFKPDLLMPLDDVKRGVAALVERVKRTPRRPGVDEIRIPGERAFRSRERLLREGLEIDRLVHDELTRLAGRNAR